MSESFRAVQVTARWGDVVVGVFRVEARDRFRVVGDVEGELTFDIEDIPPFEGDARALRRTSLRSIGAAIATLAAHACLAFFAARATPPSEDEASVAQMSAMRVYLTKIDEAEEMRDPCNGDDLTPEQTSACEARPTNRVYSIRWHEWLEPIPDGPDGCAAFGDFWFAVMPWCTASRQGSFEAGLSERVVTDALHAHVRGSPPPTIRLERLRAFGDVSRVVIAQKLDELEPAFAACYETALRVNPDLEGPTDFELHVERGAVRFAYLPSSWDFGDLDTCATRALYRGLRFDGETVTATFTLAFSPYSQQK
jgi:hypothetical protein